MYLHRKPTRGLKKIPKQVCGRLLHRQSATPSAASSRRLRPRRHRNLCRLWPLLRAQPPRLLPNRRNFHPLKPRLPPKSTTLHFSKNTRVPVSASARSVLFCRMRPRSTQRLRAQCIDPTIRSTRSGKHLRQQNGKRRLHGSLQACEKPRRWHWGLVRPTGRPRGLHPASYPSTRMISSRNSHRTPTLP